MKKIVLVFILLLIVSSYSLKAQNLIAVQGGGNASFYTTLDDAISNANNGDYIYLPGGDFTINNPINKEVHIVGVGHNPDSTQSTRKTTIGNIYLQSGASYGSLNGLLISSINVTNSVSNYSIIRCRVSNLGFTSICTNWVFIENVLQGAFSTNDINCLNFILSNNIIESYCNIPLFNNSIFKNNIFLYQAYRAEYYGTNYTIASNNSTYENNIFISNNLIYYGVYTSSSAISSTNSIFNNNIFVENWQPSSSNNCYGSNNIVSQTPSTIFINQAGNVFSYSHDYHLQTSCPGKNTGTDGTDIGIYGGAYSWKSGSVPNYPHIINSSIGVGTNTNGALPVNIKVEAQGN